MDTEEDSSEVGQESLGYSYGQQQDFMEEGEENNEPQHRQYWSASQQQRGSTRQNNDYMSNMFLDYENGYISDSNADEPPRVFEEGDSDMFVQQEEEQPIEPQQDLQQTGHQENGTDTAKSIMSLLQTSHPEFNMLDIYSDIENLFNAIMEAVQHSSAIPLPLPDNKPEFNPDKVKDERSVNRPRDSFPIIALKALGLGLQSILENGGVSFSIGTMCSGTDGPIMALQEFEDALGACGLSGTMKFEHKFSVEIEPFKQAFIDRNVRPTGEIFRNVYDLGRPGAVTAMTASGSMAPIPTEVDILIAGSSCVDFSSLNTQKQKIAELSGMKKIFKAVMKNDSGPIVALEDDESFLRDLNSLTENLDAERESTKTFISILQYARQYRPKIVILENVMSAPWNEFRTFWFSNIGYHAAVTPVDSKNFLVPQTRQRKYLIAIDARYYGLDGAESISEKWVELMGRSNWFQNPPRLDSFLLNPSDRRVSQARFQMERTVSTKNKKEVEATNCRMDHLSARRNEGLGGSHPYTQMDDYGNVQPREDCWTGYVGKGTTPRMQDLMDISSLRAAKKSQDFSYKPIILDLGQNVDRQNRKQGTAPCVLPFAELFLSSAGRPILGLECMSLQGIPIDRIKPFVDKESQLRDLAGNAMTTTVVGATILCALIAERQHTVVVDPDDLFGTGLPKANHVVAGERRRYNSSQAGMDVDMEGTAHLTEQVNRQTFSPSSTAEDTTFNLNNLHTNLPGHCNKGKNPASEFFLNTQEVEVKMEAPEWEVAEVHMDDSMTPVWKLRMLCQEGRRYCLCDDYRKHQKSGKYYRCDFCDEVRCTSCAGNPKHHFDKDHPVNTTLSTDRNTAYQAAIALFPAKIILNLASSDDSLFEEIDEKGLGSHSDALETAIRTCTGGVHYYQTDLEFRDDLTVTYESEKSRIIIVATPESVTWSVYLRNLFLQHDIKLQLRQEPLENDVGSFSQTITEVQGFPSLKTDVAPNLEGVFKFTNKCATPGGLLYVRNDDPSHRVYHIQHVEPLPVTTHDRWVVTDNPRKLETDQTRNIMLSFDQDYVHFCRYMDEVEHPSAREILATLPGVWMRLQPSFHIHTIGRDTSNAIQLRNLDSQEIHGGSCESTKVSIKLRLNVVDMHFPVPSLSAHWTPNQNSCPKGHLTKDEEPWVTVPDHHVKDALGQVAFAMNRIDGNSSRLHIQDITLDGEKKCVSCALPQPQICHVWHDDGSLERIEDSQVATQIVRNHHSREFPFKVEAWLNRGYGGDPGFLLLSMQISLNPLALVHRAFSYIPQNANALSNIAKLRHGKGSFKVQFNFSDPSLKELAPYRESLRSTAGDDTFTIQQPPSFLKNGMTLRDDQLAAVEWMLKRENSEKAFIEKEIEECVLPSVNVRMYGAAEIMNRSRGGVLAHDIGYGKTVVTLGLIDLSPKGPQSQTGSIQEHQYHKIPGNGLICIDATLIVVPPHIVSQWVEEIRRFLGSNWKVHVIRKHTDIDREKMSKADIIVASTSIQSSDKVLDKMAAMSMLPSIHQTKSALKGRDFQDWYLDVLKALGESGFDFANPNMMNGSQLEERLANLRIDSKSQAQQASSGNVGPSSRKGQLTAKALTKAAAKKSSKNGNGSKTLDILDIFKKGQLLEMYAFGRVVLDEFSYENPQVALFIQHVNAQAKFILSGTPPMSKLADLCDTSSLINTHVARFTPTPGYFPYITTGPRVTEQTAGEEFLSYRDPSSAQLATERHEQGQKFIEHFFRKNSTNSSHVKVDEYVVFAPMSHHDALIYNLMQQVLYGAKWDVNEIPSYLKHLARHILDREKAGSIGSRVRGAGKSTYSEAIDVLLLLSSVSTSYSRSALHAMGWVKEGQKLTMDTIMKNAKGTALSYLNQCCEILSSQMDLMMYLADAIKQDKSERSNTRKAKEDSYMAHMEDILTIFKKGSNSTAFGDQDCLFYVKETIIHKHHINGPGFCYRRPPANKLWHYSTWKRNKGGPGRYNRANWWLLEPGEDLPDDEMQDLRHHLPDDVDLDKEELIVKIRERQEVEGIQMMNRPIGLKLDSSDKDISVRLAKHLSGKSTKDDFEFGIQLPSKRPKVGENTSPRGQSIDATLNYFMLVIQSIQAGIKITTEAWRRNTFATKAAILVSGQLGDHRDYATRCDQCHCLDKTSGSLSVACGHTLCKKCCDDFNHSDEQMCPAECTSTSRGTFLPWTSFVDPTYGNLHEDLAEFPSLKVECIHDTIVDEVEPGEKVLIFAAHKGIKEEVYNFLKAENQTGPLGVYMTDGGHDDSESIENFKKHEGSAVLIQSLMSSESAGTNLTQASHLMFAGTLCTDSENYEMYMQQAKGRVVRQGQERPVRIYHFVSPATMEFDVMNKRLKGKLRNWGQPGEFVPLPIPDDAPADLDYPRKFRPFLDLAQSRKLLRSIEVGEFEDK
nr:DNA repair protein RAD8 [Colletotrichum truncatum]KAF6794834.1 DNA repair protein RAD8 [Colletotrichum truncatum]